ncbi:hypothetical protein NKG94_41190 [Micromonospora sp. M12]
MAGLDALAGRLTADGHRGRTCSGWIRPVRAGRWWRSATRTTPTGC